MPFYLTREDDPRTAECQDAAEFRNYGARYLMHLPFSVMEHALW